MFKLDNLSVTFGSGPTGVNAVQQISFAIGSGKTLGIVGESGSGKSVTSLALMQLIPKGTGRIDSGSALLQVKGGQVVDLLKLSEAQIRSFRGNDISMVFQEPMSSLNPVFTCGDQVAETLKIHRNLSNDEARSEVIGLFNKVKLPRPEEMYTSYPHQLSGGQKQRVMIAMAIACQPRLLIADEPTTALDVTVQAAILDLLKEIQKETGMGMIFITHDLGVVKSLADDVLVMYKGKAVEFGPACEVLNAPEHPYTKSLLACRPSSNFNLSRLPVVSDFMMEDGKGGWREITHSSEPIIKDLSVKPESAGRTSEIDTTQSPLLSVRGLKVVFRERAGLFSEAKGVIAVDDVSFDVYRGETLGLVGESGCGKTTLGRAILQLMEAGAGQVLYDGVDLCTMKSAAMRAMRRKIQIVFQDPFSSLNPKMTVGEAIIEPMLVHRLYKNVKECRAHAIELIQNVGLKEEHFNRYPHQFSGGQRQRICIARTLALQPEFVICDESVSALDVSVQAQVLNLLNDIKSKYGLTYIFISHDLSVVRYMSDRMMVMNKGRIVEMGKADEVYERPASDYTRRLIAAIPH